MIMSTTTTITIVTTTPNIVSTKPSMMFAVIVWMAEICFSVIILVFVFAFARVV